MPADHAKEVADCKQLIRTLTICESRRMNQWEVQVDGGTFVACKALVSLQCHSCPYPLSSTHRLSCVARIMDFVLCRLPPTHCHSASRGSLHCSDRARASRSSHFDSATSDQPFLFNHSCHASGETPIVAHLDVCRAVWSCLRECVLGWVHVSCIRTPPLITRLVVSSSHPMQHVTMCSRPATCLAAMKTLLWSIAHFSTAAAATPNAPSKGLQEEEVRAWSFPSLQLTV